MAAIEHLKKISRQISSRAYNAAWRQSLEDHAKGLSCSRNELTITLNKRTP